MGKPAKLNGISSGGNWIVDKVKIIDKLPDRGMLGNIIKESSAYGGAPANVLMSLAKMGADFPLNGYGLVGNDTDGEEMCSTFRNSNINMDGVIRTDQSSTPYTDVMTDQSSGDRTFFHYRGANSMFSPEDLDLKKLSCKIFHLGYLLLLDKFDEKSNDFGTVAAGFLKKIQALGIKTSVDVVSEEGERFRKIVPPALKFTDYLIMNEIEAGKTADITVRNANGEINKNKLVKAVDIVAGMGNIELIAIHMPEGAYIRLKDGNCLSIGSLKLPDDYIKGAVGAGDAFCAAMLYGIHENWSPLKSAELGVCAAAACLSAENSTSGLRNVNELFQLADKYKSRPDPI